MPTYNFRDKNTGEVIEKVLTISNRDIFLQEHPNYESIILRAPGLGDGFRMNPKRHVDNGFREVLARVHEKSPGSQLDKQSSIDF